LVPPVLLKTPLARHRTAGFTLIEVMMAAVILVVGFVGMIEAVILSQNMMNNARRQTLAAQIMSHEMEQLRLQSWANISLLPASQTLGATYSAGTVYYAGDTCTYNGTWYRCTQGGSGNTSGSGSSYWSADTPPYNNTLGTTGVALGATYTLTRSVADVVSGNMREITLTVTWKVATSRRDSLTSFGNQLQFTYSRVNVAYFGKYGLSLTYQRS